MTKGELLAALAGLSDDTMVVLLDPWTEDHNEFRIEVDEMGDGTILGARIVSGEIDPCLLAAREAVAKRLNGQGRPNAALMVREGRWDAYADMQAALDGARQLMAAMNGRG